MAYIGREVIAKTLRRRLGLAPLEAANVVNELFGTVGDGGKLLKPGLFHQAVAANKEVVIRGFCKMTRRARKARKIKHPRTDETYDLPKRHHPHFTASEAFKQYVDDQANQNPEW